MLASPASGILQRRLRSSPGTVYCRHVELKKKQLVEPLKGRLIGPYLSASSAQSPSRLRRGSLFEGLRLFVSTHPRQRQQAALRSCSPELQTKERALFDNRLQPGIYSLKGKKSAPPPVDTTILASSMFCDSPPNMYRTSNSGGGRTPVFVIAFDCSIPLTTARPPWLFRRPLRTWGSTSTYCPTDMIIAVLNW
jgi:hypothetical protein